MRAPNARQREAIESLQRHGAQWTILMEWFQQNLGLAHVECARADDVAHVRRAQGQARCLADTLELLKMKI